MRSIHFRAIPGVLLAGLLLAIVAGSLAYFFRLSRIDEQLLRQAQVESVHLLEASAANGQLGKGLALLTQGRFLLVRAYDPARTLLGQSISGDADPSLASFAPARPLPFDLEHPSFQRLQIGPLSALGVSFPLLRDGKAWGLLEGVYLMSPADEKRIHDELLREAMFVVLTVLVTAVLLYPVTVGLCRWQSRPSATALSGNLEVLEMVGNMIASRDAESNAHNYRVTLYALRLADEAGLPQSARTGLIAGAFLHDLGKIAIRDAILLKPGHLSESETVEMRQHVRRGVELVKRSRWLAQAREVIEFHHEKFDGSGYPRGVSGEKIPLAARIFAIADVFDALTSIRPYKSAASLEDALEVITREAGRHFDPHLVACFLVVAADAHARWQGATEDTLRAALEPHLNAACSA
ncbi:HD-GYP domain-containing protein [Cognatazoarcus halotolerans]|uniref:HD-GYP domain-containing protein n=1 Tax=Cognatazoarcus halotolerans TaxID=2686016 RepID=UPI00135B4754|nr:HD domain-containing phosphohydrolase [Cognatazoarcus halotolerans]MBX3680804.1 HD domain-containing protein [Rhodocyclaceae bacterium]MCB1899665.1 HD domain-containing protein [Rhodocyclaceae bacterium]MCP5308362.1 HD domain-containing protein [Zoogloeaceae bacterium]